MTDQKKLLLIFLLALLGFMDASWLSVQSLVVEARALCGPIGNCSEVLTSQYARVFGVPVALFGMVMYLALLLLTYWGTATGGRVPALVRGLSLAGTILSAGLMALLAFVLKTFCLFCVLSAVIVTLIWLLSRSITAPGTKAQPAGKTGGGLLSYAASGIVALLFVVFGWSVWTGISPHSGIVARIGDEVITEDRMLRELAIFSAETERNLQQMKINWANNLIVTRLLEKEAARRGISVPALAEQATAGEITIAESEMTAVARAWVGDALDLTPTEWEQVHTFVIQQKREERLLRLADSLRTVYGAEVFLEPIPVVNPMLDLSGSPTIGRPDAPVLIVVFTDFQCPFCSSVAALLNEVRRRYPDEVTIVVKNLPLDFHPQAALAAEASLCARELGAYHTYHDLLFANQSNLDPASLHRYAAQAGLDTVKFAECLSAGFHRQYVERDINEANRNGVTGTPTVFINGRPLMGTLSLERLQQEIEFSLH